MDANTLRALTGHRAHCKPDYKSNGALVWDPPARHPEKSYSVFSTETYWLVELQIFSGTYIGLAGFLSFNKALAVPSIELTGLSLD